jgi:septal ring factor EnvC (AmiA/AmiB activator)
MRTRESDVDQRSRSLSPSQVNISPADAVRSVKNALRNRDKDIQQLEQKLNQNEKLIHELNGKLNKAAETKRSLEKEIGDMKRDYNNM